MAVINEAVTLERVIEAVERCQTGTENLGFCIHCGAEVDGVEPDARGYECEECGERKVYGAEELLMMLAI